MFQVGDKIVHPMHGAGIIESVVEEKISGSIVQFYVFKMPISGLVLKIPTANAEGIGVRPILSPAQIEDVLSKIEGLGIDMTSNWNHRYRENMERIKSGDLLEVASVVKALMHRDAERGLSTGERRMLHNAKQIMVTEIVLSEEGVYTEVEGRLAAAMLKGADE